MRTLVIGAAIIDLMMEIDRLPKSGEDVSCNKTKTVVGGCAYNVASTLRNFECDHDLLVPIGKGPFADIISMELKDKGYKQMIHQREEDNGYCLSLIESDGERTFITVEGAECNFKSEWLNKIDMKIYENIYLAGYQVCGKSGKIILDWIKNILNEENKKFYFAPGPVINDIDSVIMESFFELKPILHINELEAKSYTKQAILEDAIRSLYEKTRNYVFITLGSNGTLFYDGKEVKHVPAIKTDVVDTVGAGDSHIGAIISGLSMGMKVEEAVLLANKAASLIVGTSGPTIEREKFQIFMEDLLNE